jgi:hypothetical protein
MGSLDFSNSLSDNFLLIKCKEVMKSMNIELARMDPLCALVSNTRRADEFPALVIILVSLGWNFSQLQCVQQKWNAI